MNYATPLYNFLNLFETNRYTLHLVVALLGLSFFKYLNIRWPKLNPKTVLMLILGLGFILRVAWLCFSSHEPHFSWNHLSMNENDNINMHAVDITRGEWFVGKHGQPIAWRPIGYPIFLGLVYKLFGANVLVAHVSSLLLYLVTGLLIFLLGRQLFTERVGLLATFWFAIYPISIYSIPLVTDEHFFLPLWYLGLYLLLREVKGSKRLPLALLWYGLIFGYAMITRTNVIFMPFIVAFTYFLLRRPWRKILVAFAAVLLVMQLVNLPWVIRNYKIWHVPVFFTATAFYTYATFFVHADETGSAGAIPARGEPGFSEELESAKKTGNEGLINQVYKKEITRWIIAHPKKFALMGVSKLTRFIGWRRAEAVWPLWYQYYAGHYDPARPISVELKDFFQELAFSAYYTLFFTLIFSIIMISVRWRDVPPDSRIAILTIAACLFIWLLEQTIVPAERKHRFALEPLMMLPAAFFWDRVLFVFRWETLWTNLKNNIFRRSSVSN